MFARRNDLLDWRIDAALQALQQVLRVLTRAEHILSGSLLASAPFVSCQPLEQSFVSLRLLTARVSVTIDIRGEEVQAGTTGIAVCACFSGDDGSNLEHKVVVECRRS